MIFKTKAIGLLAGSALALSVATGSLADTQSTATVTLSPNSSAQGCTIRSIEISDSLEATWDGSKYVVPDTSTPNWAKMWLGFDSASPDDTGSCDVYASGTDFTGQGNSANTFEIGRLALGGGAYVSSDSDNPTQFLRGVTPNPNPEEPWYVPLILDLDGVTVPPDNYVSTLTFTIINHQD